MILNSNAYREISELAYPFQLKEPSFLSELESRLRKTYRLGAKLTSVWDCTAFVFTFMK